MMKSKLFMRAVLVCILTLTLITQAAVINVPTDFTTIQSAIDAAVDGDEIVLNEGVYRGTGNRDLTFRGKTLWLHSKTGPLNCIIDAEGSENKQHNAFVFSSGETLESVIEGLTLTNGYAIKGGAIECFESSVTVRSCIIRNNTAVEQGGVIYLIFDSAVSFSNCLLADNYADQQGGAIVAERESSVTLVNCTMTNNRSRNIGGALFLFSNSRASLYNSILWGNHAFGNSQIVLRYRCSLAASHSDIQGGEVGIVAIEDSDRVSWGEGNLDRDPCFTNSVAAAYHLDAVSPCRDAGTETIPGGLSPTDLQGEIRSIDGDNDGQARPDMGAYEASPKDFPVIQLSRQKVHFSIYEGDPNPEQAVLSIRNSGYGTLNWKLDYDTDWVKWLNVTPAQGVSNGDSSDIILSVDTTDLDYGTYKCCLTISSPLATNSPFKVPVVLEIYHPGTPWTTYQGNASHNGYIPISLDPNNFSLLWSNQPHPRNGLSPVSIAHNKVFLEQGTYISPSNRYNNSLCALDISDGSEVWSVNFGSLRFQSPVSYYEGKVYFQTCKAGSNSIPAYLRAFEAISGQPVFNSPFATQGKYHYAPTIFDGIVYANGGYHEGINAVDAENGLWLWFANTRQVDQWTPAVDDDHVFGYVGTYPSLYVIDRPTGELLFNIFDPNNNDHMYSMRIAPVIGEQNNIVVSNGKRLVSFDLVNRSVGWEISDGFTGQPSVAGGVIYCANNGTVEARSETTGKFLWSWNTPLDEVSYPMVITDTHLFVSTQSTTHAINISTHQDDWSFPAPGNLALGNGTLCIAGPQGKLTAIRTERQEYGTLIGLDIHGPNEVGDNYQIQYQAIAHYSNGRTKNVTSSVDWNIAPASPGYEISGGLLSIESLDSTQDATILVHYTEESIELSAQLNIHIYPYTPYKYVPSEFPTIQAAIDAARENDTIIVAPGTYTGHGNRDIDFKGKPVTVRSLDPNNPDIVASTVIDIDGNEWEAHRGFYFHTGEQRNSIIAGLTIRHGYAVYGAGIYCDVGCSPTISKCLIKENTSRSQGRGAGIYCLGDAFISGCTITGNLAYWAGGGVFSEECSPTITDCSIIGNEAIYGYGGGVCFAKGGNPLLYHSNIADNRASGSQGQGGGIYCSSDASIIRCKVSGNWARLYGGGIGCSFASPVFSNCIIASNGPDGIVCSNGSSPAIVNSVIHENFTRGICAFYDSEATITNSILRHNQIELFSQYNGSVNLRYCNIQGGWFGLGNIDVDPQFLDAGNGDYRLLPSSPCIDAGDPNYVPGPEETDFDGNPRIVDGDDDGNAVVDIGAYEFAPTIALIMKLTPRTLNCRSKGNWVKAHITLPEGFTVEDVDADKPAVLRGFGFESAALNVFVNENELVEIEAAFRREDICSLAGNWPETLTVYGFFSDGSVFLGTSTVRIIGPGLKDINELAVRWLETDCSHPHWCGGLDLNKDSIVNYADFALLQSGQIEFVNK